MYLSVILVSTVFSCSEQETTQPQKVDIVDAVFASGNVVYEHEYQVTAKVEGYLVSSEVEEGSLVDSQKPLFRLSNAVQGEQLSNAELNYQDAVSRLDERSPERVKQELQIAQAKAQLDEKNYQRYEKLIATEAVSKADYERVKLQYENAKSNLAVQEAILADLFNGLQINAKNAESQVVIQKETNTDYFLSSMISGEVIKLFKKPGDLVKRGEVVATIGGGKKLAKLLVSEEDIALLALNQKVVINLNTHKEAIYAGSIWKIHPSFDTNEQSFVIESSFEEEPFRLYHNTQLQANIVIDQKANALVIPRDYFDQQKNQVTLENGELKTVKVGIKNEQWVEILEGITRESVLVKPKSL